MRGLRAVGAILGTAAGLDRQQAGQLDGVRIEMGAMGLLCAMDQVHERKVVQLQDLLGAPGGGFGHRQESSGRGCRRSASGGLQSVSRGSRRLRRLGGLRLRSADRMKPGGVCAMPGIWLEMRGGSICFWRFGDFRASREATRRHLRGRRGADFDSICKFEIGEKSLAWPMWARGSMAAMLRLGDRDREIVLAAATSGGVAAACGAAGWRAAGMPYLAGRAGMFRGSWRARGHASLVGRYAAIGGSQAEGNICERKTKSSGIRSFSMMARRLFRGVRRWRKVLWRSGRGSNPRPRRDRPVF